MFHQRAFYIPLCLFAVSIVAALPPNTGFDESHLPSFRLSRDEVQEMKEGQTYPPGYIHQYVTLGKGSKAVSVPIVEADPDILLDNADGVRARSLVARGTCQSIPSSGRTCFITYCWTGNDGTSYAESIEITDKNGKSNPSSMSSSNSSNLWLNSVYNTGYNGWFAHGHECSNDNTITYTSHLSADGVAGVAYVSKLECNNCNIGGLGCLTGALSNNHNLVAITQGSFMMC